MIGDGSKRNFYQKEYPSIYFTGWKNSEEMQKYIHQARALIVSSKWYETMGLTVVEMQQYGIPCIVPQECAASEYVEDGKTGMLYQIGNLKDLERCIEKFKDNAEVEKMSNSFYQSLDIEKYSIDNYVHQLTDIYESSLRTGK